MDHSLEGYRTKDVFGRGSTPHAPPLFTARFATWPVFPIPGSTPSMGQQRNGIMECLKEQLPVQNQVQSSVCLGKRQIDQV